MDNRERARAWLEEHGTSQYMREHQIAALAAEFAAVRREALDQAATVCREYAERMKSEALGGAACERSIRALATPTKPGDE